jgi:hypothetical protein
MAGTLASRPEFSVRRPPSAVHSSNPPHSSWTDVHRLRRKRAPTTHIVQSCPPPCADSHAAGCRSAGVWRDTAPCSRVALWRRVGGVTLSVGLSVGVRVHAHAAGRRSQAAGRTLSFRGKIRDDSSLDHFDLPICIGIRVDEIQEAVVRCVPPEPHRTTDLDLDRKIGTCIERCHRVALRRRRGAWHLQ